MIPNTIDNPRPRLLLSLLLIVTMFYPTLKLLRSLKGGLISNPTHTASYNGMKITTIGKESVPLLIMDIAPPTPWSAGKLHRPSTFYGRCIRSKGCIPPLNWFTPWDGIPLWKPSLQPRRRRACPLPSETGWLESQPSTAGIPVETSIKRLRLFWIMITQGSVDAI